MDARKPLAPSESRESRKPFSIRLTPAELAMFTAAAIAGGQSQVSTYIRECAIAGHSFIAAQNALASHRRVTA